MVPQQQQRCQDNNIFVQIFPWKKINARFQSNTTFVILFMYFCFVYFQSGYSIIPIVVKKANKNNSSKISSRCQSSFNTVFAGFYVQKRYGNAGKSHQRILAVVNIGWNPASHTESINSLFRRPRKTACSSPSLIRGRRGSKPCAKIMEHTRQSNQCIKVPKYNALTNTIEF